MIANGYRLGQVHEDDPSIPPFDLRSSLVPGDLAELLIETPDEFQARWVLIDHVLGPGTYLGTDEEGDEIEFGPENILDLEERRHFSQSPSPSLGAWYDIFKPRAEKPKPASQRPGARPFETLRPEAKPPELWEILVPEAEKRDPYFEYSKVFDIFGPSGKPAPRPAPPPRTATPPPPEGEKPGWFDFLRRKPKTEIIGPIPPAERREQHSFRRLPGPPPPPGPMVTAEEVPIGPAPAPQPQSIIVPEVQASLSPIAGEPTSYSDLFDILGPAPEAPAPGRAPAPQASLPAAVVTESALPVHMDAFSILEPTASVSEAFGRPGQAVNPFEIIQPDQLDQPTPFDILSPQSEAEPREMVVRTEGGLPTQMDVFNVLEPQVQTYGPPAAEGPSLFDVLAPPPPPPSPPPPAAAPAPQKKVRRKSGPWSMPSREEWVRWIQITFNLDKLWKYLRDERNSEYWIENQLNEEVASAPVETWADLDWDTAFAYLGVPESAYGPYLDKIAEEDEKYGYADEAWQDFNDNFLGPLSLAISNAFEIIQPDDIPGYFILDDDGDTGTWGLIYYERLDPKKANKRQKEMLAQKELDAREAKETERRLKAEVKRIWGKMPGPEDLVGWIEEKFDLDAMFSDIHKARRLKAWKNDLKENGEAELELEVIADLGPKRSKEYEYDIASYFGIPPDIIALYQEAESGQELWNDIFWPFFSNIQDAFSMLLPYAELPGQIAVDEDDDDHLVISYLEEEGD